MTEDGSTTSQHGNTAHRRLRGKVDSSSAPSQAVDIIQSQFLSLLQLRYVCRSSYQTFYRFVTSDGHSIYLLSHTHDVCAALWHKMVPEAHSVKLNNSAPCLKWEARRRRKQKKAYFRICDVQTLGVGADVDGM